MRGTRRRSRILSAIRLPSRRWRHPWSLSPRWSPDLSRWEALIKPGLVNGLDPSIQVTAESAPADTLARLREEVGQGKRDATYDAWLRESPAISLMNVRAIGFGATPVSVGDSGEVSYEAVPAFFIAKGVLPPPTQSLTDAGLVTQYQGLQEDELPRFLRATDLVLYHDRVATVPSVTVSDGSDGSIVEIRATLTKNANARERAYIRTTSLYTPKQTGSQLDYLLGNWVDQPWDQLHMATVYLLSPPGSDPLIEADESWQPYVKHRVFWNLSYAANKLPTPTPVNNLVLHTNLALGLSNLLADFILGQINDAQNAANLFLANNDVSGDFWS